MDSGNRPSAVFEPATTRAHNASAHCRQRMQAERMLVPALVERLDEQIELAQLRLDMVLPSPSSRTQRPTRGASGWSSAQRCYSVTRSTLRIAQLLCWPHVRKSSQIARLIARARVKAIERIMKTTTCRSVLPEVFTRLSSDTSARRSRRLSAAFVHLRNPSGLFRLSAFLLFARIQIRVNVEENVIGVI